MRSTLVLGVVAAGIVLAGCPQFGHWCDEGYCDPKADAGLDGTLPDGFVPDGTIPEAGPDAEPPPKDCLTPTEPVKNPEKCLVDAFGAFVSPSGDDANDGSKAKPFKTIGRALQGVRTRIVVCEGEYAGSVDVTRAVEIYGGVSCDFTKAGANEGCRDEARVRREGGEGERRGGAGGPRRRRHERRGGEREQRGGVRDGEREREAASVACGGGGWCGCFGCARW